MLQIKEESETSDWSEAATFAFRSEPEVEAGTVDHSESELDSEDATSAQLDTGDEEATTRIPETEEDADGETKVVQCCACIRHLLSAPSACRVRTVSPLLLRIKPLPCTEVPIQSTHSCVLPTKLFACIILFIPPLCNTIPVVYEFKTQCYYTFFLISAKAYTKLRTSTTHVIVH